jgi:hypothetical protein
MLQFLLNVVGFLTPLHSFLDKGNRTLMRGPEIPSLCFKAENHLLCSLVPFLMEPSRVALLCYKLMRFGVVFSGKEARAPSVPLRTECQQSVAGSGPACKEKDPDGQVCVGFSSIIILSHLDTRGAVPINLRLRGSARPILIPLWWVLSISFLFPFSMLISRGEHH